MRRGCILLLGLVLLGACAPTAPPLQLPQDCRAVQAVEELTGGHWRQQENVWRLRQTLLFDFGFRKLAAEGFLRLDTGNGTLRMVAMNEIGLVLFDLEVTNDDEKLHRAIPQLEKRQKLLASIATNLRRIFLAPLPDGNDRLENLGYAQVLIRTGEGESIRFLFDCPGDLRESRGRDKSGSWRVLYNRYTDRAGSRLPDEIILNDTSANIKMSFELKEVKQE